MHYKLLILILLFSVAGFAQTDKPFTGTKNVKAERFFIEGLQAINAFDFKTGLARLKQSLALDSNYIDAWMLLADVKEQNEQYSEAMNIYRKVVIINPDFQIPYYKFANSALKDGSYEEAMRNLKLYEEKGGTQIEETKIERAKVTAAFGMEALKHPVPFEPKNLGPNVNTPLNEYFPGVTADDQTLIFTRLDRGMDENFYMSKKVNNDWAPAISIGSPVNTEQNEGTISLSSDGQYIFYTGCNKPDGEGSCDLYFSALDGDSWKDPQNFGFPVNTRAWESQPSISFDGKTVYFSSSRPGGFGESDLWYTTYQKGKWGPPVNLGMEINTVGSEQSPLIAKDDQTLYFISDFHAGMGGMDIFVSRRQPDGRWGKPENLGYPINTSHDEMCMALSANGKEAFIASERKEGYGGLDIYSFELYEKARPSKTGYVKGMVYDAKSLKKLKGKLELIDLETGKTIIETYSNRLTGAFLFVLQGNKNYALNVSCAGYLFYSENFSLKNQSASEPLVLDIPLNPILAGERVVLKNVFFDVQKYTLRDESKIELDRLAAFLKANPTIKIELSGHTDNTGAKQHNLELSTSRAKAVYDYLILHGIDKTRLTYKGYADTQPVADNKTEKGKQQNRRTEFKILGR